MSVDEIFEEKIPEQTDEEIQPLNELFQTLLVIFPELIESATEKLARQLARTSQYLGQILREYFTFLLKEVSTCLLRTEYIYYSNGEYYSSPNPLHLIENSSKNESVLNENMPGSDGRVRNVDPVALIRVRGGKKWQIRGTNYLYPIGGIICEVVLKNNPKYNFQADENDSIVIYHGPDRRSMGGSYRFGPKCKTRAVPHAEFIQAMTNGYQANN